MNKIEFSKILIIAISIISIIVTVVSIIATFKFEDTTILCYLIPSIFAELASATASYYLKAKNENKVKIILGAVKEIASDKEGYTDEQTRVIESMINGLNS